MMKKRIIFLLLIITLFTMPKYAYASSSYGTGGGPGPSGDYVGGGKPCLDGLIECDGGTFVECRVSARLEKWWFEYGYELYDLNDNPISQSQPLIAGTPFGASVYELRTQAWSAYPGAQYKYQCKKMEKQTVTAWCPIHGEDDEVIGYFDCSYEIDVKIPVEKICPRYDPANCQVAANELGYNMAKNAIDYGASFSLNASDPNDYRCAEPEKYKEELERDGVYCQNFEIETDDSKPVSGKYSNPVVKKIYYRMYGACVNVKSAKVRYLKSSTEKCSKEEIYVPNKTGTDEHWHVFTPLNTKETKDYTLELTSNKETILEKKICEGYINDYPKELEDRPREYMNIIKPLEGEFTGNIVTDKRLVQGGCYTYTAIKLNVSQKFYNEVKENEYTSSFVGYDFYYRPIDINNPFPNGITDDSFWKAWSESGSKDPDLTKSFKNITYISHNIDLDEVRKYNKNNHYSSWYYMNLDGTSEYIDKSGIITRNPEAKKDEIYNLGCGPSNADWEECKK